MNKHQLLVAAACACTAPILLHVAVRQIDKASPLILRAAPAVSVPAVYRSLRPNYPFSVIAGGAYSPAELRSSNRNDAVVRAHYANFNLNDARLVTVSADRYQYVSFRLHNQVFWTHKKLRIRKGEVLLTDGTYCARTRCGNRLSDTAGSPTTREEPSEALLSLPDYELGMQPELDLVKTPITDQAPLAALPIDTVLFKPSAVFAEDTSIQRSAPSPFSVGNPAFLWLGPAYLPGFATGLSGGSSSAPAGNIAVVAAAIPAAAPEPGTLGFFTVALCLWLCAVGRMIWSAKRRSRFRWPQSR